MVWQSHGRSWLSSDECRTEEVFLGPRCWDGRSAARIVLVVLLLVEYFNMAGTNMFSVEHGLQTFFMSFKLELPFFLFSDNYKQTFIDCWLLEK